MTPELFRHALQASMMLTVLSIGLQGRFGDLAYVGPRAATFFKAIVAVYVIVPLVAFLLLMAFPVPRLTRAGIIIMAVSPLCPFALPRMLRAGADRAYVIGLYSALMCAAILLVPTCAAFVVTLANKTYELAIPPIALLVGVTILLPLILGMVIAAVLPGIAKDAARIASFLGYAMILLVFAFILYRAGGEMLALVGNGTLLVILVTIAAGYLGGHLLGGPEPEHRIALAQAAATRHPALALLIAEMLFADRQVQLAILLFMFVGVVVSLLYTFWMGRARLRPAVEQA